MADEEGSRSRACPLCGQPVETVRRRHKTLGVFVPVWGAGPCRNPECPACVEGTEDAVDAPVSDSDGQRSQPH